MIIGLAPRSVANVSLADIRYQADIKYAHRITMRAPFLVPTVRLELTRLTSLPPQDSVSTNFTTSATCTIECHVRYLAGQQNLARKLYNNIPNYSAKNCLKNAAIKGASDTSR